ncbi:MAG: rod shape-determining protein MreD [Pseudomonadales bacterium]|jgi:rod shape-determining protein MreD|uniref:rod shape-determining protein MreD n=1 Tax=Halopseudomonas TaxID=2901189 RepID=UPI000C390F14|nr:MULTISPECIES: rod shape-determining protein MreD [Halopseudomonas]MAH00664.1 rod shape-determining protein MreD [Pseudomonadales bacterium]MEE2798409.1 rod shape-determining protein MreD [Pseudomonadota bacterium]HBT56131.1 rod shape-determining protein MreD [Pseudomonas sp.]MAK75272.1 rod shape-determining protein MreD [Pseudomonadales bacterium]MAP77249.1 rod shape-determining protein MreD [Pseudomonadales bacterium]|tara:strand:+ start:3144 stop:3617 length:474 start_codon:yes stop_codon:yes gene_type:complete
MQTSLAIILSILAALLLSVMPMPDPVSLGRPMWLAMVLAYWVMALPHRVGLLTAWLAGLVSDVLFGQLFGQNALVMTLVVWMVLLLYQRIRRFPLWQQSLVMLPVFGIAQMVLLWLNSLSGNRPPTLLFLLPAVVSAVLWPWVFSLLRGVRRRFHVN